MDVPGSASTVTGSGSSSGGASTSQGSAWGTCESIGALHIKNWYFSANTNATLQQERENTVGNSSKLALWVTRAPSHTPSGYEKSLVRPQNVHYYSVHMVTLGGQMVRVNPDQDLRLVHYKPPTFKTFTDIDMSMANRSAAVQSLVEVVQRGGPLPPPTILA